MIIAIVSPKGGVGKTTTAIHLAAYLQERAPMLLVDGDENRSSVGWSKRGSLPFRVCAETQTAKFAPEAKHIVIDTAARPPREEIEELLETADQLVVPCSPDALALYALVPFGERTTRQRRRPPLRNTTHYSLGSAEDRERDTISLVNGVELEAASYPRLFVALQAPFRKTLPFDQEVEHAINANQQPVEILLDQFPNPALETFADA